MSRLDTYKCDKCGNIVELLHAGGGKLVCCGQPMDLLVENTTDAAQEKHVPVVEKINGGFRVSVGSVSHPMEKEHFIEWIDLVADGKVYREFLSPQDPPEAVFNVTADNVYAREYCTLHGLWKG